MPPSSIRHSALGTRHFPAFGIRHFPRALGLIELLTIVAVLVIGLAFIVSMARHVRSASANELTRKRMAALVEAARRLAEQGIDPTLPMPRALREERNRPGRDEQAATEAAMGLFARQSSRHFADQIAAARKSADAARLPGAIGQVAENLASGPPEPNDAWGNPIALLPGQHPLVGMAPDDGPFLVSAGPDGRFLSLADNLYSYDLPARLPGSVKKGVAAPPEAPQNDPPDLAVQTP